jgi:uncharacterized membrane protein
MLDRTKSLVAAAGSLVAASGLDAINLSTVADLLQAVAGALLAFVAFRAGNKTPDSPAQETKTSGRKGVK